MPIKAFINNQENGIITYKGDTEPCKVYIDGNLVENLSYIDENIGGEGVNSVEYKSEYKKNIRTMQIDGNTEQYQGTFAPQNITIPTSYVIPSSAPIIVSETPITVPNGARLTLTANKTGNGNISSLSSGFIVIISDSQDDIANNYTEILEDYGTPQYLATPKVSGQFYIGVANFLSGGIGNPQSYWDFLRANYTFTLSTEGNTVPSPDYPQPIHNANDNGMSLELRGKNLFDGSRELEFKRAGVTKEFSDNTIILKADSRVSAAAYRFKAIPVVIGKKYTVSATSISATVGNFAVYLSYDNNQDTYQYGRLNATNPSMTFTATADTLYIKGYIAWANSVGETIITNLQVEESPTKTPYEPYFEPVTVKIPPNVTVDGTEIPLRFAKYKNADYLLINRTNGTVKYYQYSTEGDPTKPLSEQLENIPPLEYTLYDKATNITTDLGQALFELPTENQTNIITITSTPNVSKLSVNYAKYGGVI